MNKSVHGCERLPLSSCELHCSTDARTEREPKMLYSSVKRPRYARASQIKQKLEQAKSQLSMLESQRAKLLAASTFHHNQKLSVKPTRVSAADGTALKIRIPREYLSHQETSTYKRARKENAKAKAANNISLVPPSPGLSETFGRRIHAADFSDMQPSFNYFSSDSCLYLSALSSSSPANLILHVQSLRLDYTSRFLRPILRKLMVSALNRYGVFNNPVDPIAAKLPSYFDKISRPMDLGTIKGKLQDLHYRDPDAFADDVRLVFHNAMTFNDSSHPIHQSAQALLADFEVELDKLKQKLSREWLKKQSHNCRLCQGQSCSLCGDKCLQLEPPVLMCHGPCASRIRRGGVFYITPDALRLWCSKCFLSLPQELPSECGNCTSDECDDSDLESTHMPGTQVLLKKNLLRRKFDDDISEAWVQCDRCKLWLHEVCGLFNARTNISESFFTCPMCQLKKIADNSGGKEKKSSREISANGKTGGIASTGSESGGGIAPIVENRFSGGSPLCSDSTTNKKFKAEIIENSFPSDKTLSRPPPKSEAPKKTVESKLHSDVYSASSLPRTEMSNFIERRVLIRLQELGVSPSHNSINIRVVSNAPSSFEVSSPIRRTFKSDGDSGHVPKEMKYVSKALCMFQNIDGADVCLFSMYIQEHGADSAQSNARCVYLAYIDSVEYFRPRTARTHLYHEILVSYLDWVRRRGFSKVYIWSCPPQRGNNFIFWCHPEHQRTPTRERLTGWYGSMLRRCIDIGIVRNVENLYTTHFQQVARAVQRQAQLQLEGHLVISHELKPEVPPIFDGDYWLDEFHRLYRLVEKKTDADFVADQTSPLEQCCHILRSIAAMPQAAAFREPVDPELHQCLDYYLIIKQPMDLSRVSCKLNRMEYLSVEDYSSDMRLIFKNAMIYNPPKHPVHVAAKHLAQTFERHMKKLLKQMRERIGSDINLKDIHISVAMEEIAIAEQFHKNLDISVESTYNMPSSKGTHTRSSYRNEFSGFFSTEKRDSVPNTPSNLDNGNSQKSTPIDQHFKFWSSGNSLSTPRSAVKVHDRNHLSAECQSKNYSMPMNGSSSFVGKVILHDDDSATDKAFDAKLNADISTFGQCFTNPQIERMDSVNTLSEVDSTSHSEGCVCSMAKKVDESGDAVVKSVAGNKKRWILSQLCKSVDLMKRDLLVVTLSPPEFPLQDESWDDDFNKSFDIALNSETLYDPDPPFSRALVGSRHTFLEMCQYRHYQFDTLRHAKYSSAMILYHLHRPEACSLNIFCTRCKRQISYIRHHCSICFIDICESCLDHCANECSEGHHLTPFRVTFASSTSKK